MNKKQKNKIIQKTKDIFIELMTFFPHDTLYSFHLMSEEENSSGGHFAILYEPNNRKIDLYIYQRLFGEVPDLNEKQILWLIFTLAHEVGHLFIWELSEMINKKYASDFVEKAASDIAFILVNLYNTRYGKK